MQKVRKLVTTIMIAALITAMEGTTILPLSHHVKADTNTVSQTSQAENDLTKYKKINGIGDNTVLGADFSHYQLQKNAWKKVWKNYKGIEVSNVFEYVRSQGINTISVKVAVNPTKDKEGNESYLSLENAKKTLKEAKKAGLKTNVTLLYSDDITYAGVQKLPDGWDTDSAEKKALEYTKNVIKELKAADAVPTMITIGNEVNYNFLNMSSGDGWEGFVAMSKISKMIREEGIKPAVSVSAPTTDASDIQWIIGKLGNADVDYDYIGVNIYPDTHNDNYVKTLKNTVEEKAAGKQMIISSVKCPWKDSEGKASITTQTKSIYDYLQATIDEKNAGGLIYDDADFVGAWDSFFDENGQAMSSLAIFAYAQGNQVDVSTYKDPWEYGGDTGLKNLTASVKKLNNMSQSSIRGMDISSYTALKKAGVKYYDFDGKETSLLKVLHDNCKNEDIVLIHDGVRPLIDEQLITENIKSVKNHGSAITVAPVIETVMLADDDKVYKSVERSKCNMAKAPQGFFLKDIYAAHEKARAEGIHDKIDSATMMSDYGHSLYTVKCGYENIKITTPSDYFTFRALIDAKENSQIFGI